ncbi:hypothetical protein BVRB_6g143050 [Beta vulgaris subsp. vulgaris]|nr:hypothetical protein BVRB_6g143050 [Beta vulgaris subsp. vulgaris]
MYTARSVKVLKAMVTWYRSLVYLSMSQIISRQDTSI